jgi:hypothetical protein
MASGDLLEPVGEAFVEGYLKGFEEPFAKRVS